jgi:hypothetical protein
MPDNLAALVCGLGLLLIGCATEKAETSATRSPVAPGPAHGQLTARLSNMECDPEGLCTATVMVVTAYGTAAPSLPPGTAIYFSLGGIDPPETATNCALLATLSRVPPTKANPTPNPPLRAVTLQCE